MNVYIPLLTFIFRLKSVQIKLKNNNNKGVIFLQNCSNTFSSTQHSLRFKD